MKPTKSLVAALAMLVAGAAFAQGQPQDLPKIPIQAGMHVIHAQVAQTPEQMMTGLMYRREMPQQEGMIFVYPQPGQHCFWMKNTLLPLTIAFLADDGTIVNLADMQPQTLDSHCAAKPVRYALEMNLGWFAKRGITAGFKLTGPGGKPLASP